MINIQKERRKKMIPIVPGKFSSVQFKFFKLMVLTIFISLVLMTLGFYGVINVVVNTADLGRYAESQIQDISFWAKWLFLVVIIATLSIASILSFHLSQRVAGPLYRIEIALKELLNGNKPGPIKTRPKDEFKGLVELFNMLLERYKN